jgi:hypothetical protein
MLQVVTPTELQSPKLLGHRRYRFALRDRYALQRDCLRLLPRVPR